MLSRPRDADDYIAKRAGTISSPLAVLYECVTRYPVSPRYHTMVYGFQELPLITNRAILGFEDLEVVQQSSARKMFRLSRSAKRLILPSLSCMSVELVPTETARNTPRSEQSYLIDSASFMGRVDNPGTMHILCGRFGGFSVPLHDTFVSSSGLITVVHRFNLISLILSMTLLYLLLDESLHVVQLARYCSQ